MTSPVAEKHMFAMSAAKPLIQSRAVIAALKRFGTQNQPLRSPGSGRPAATAGQAPGRSRTATRQLPWLSHPG